MRIRTGRFPKMFRVGRPITSRVTPMMASGFAPTPLSPVGYEAIELHRLLIDFRVQAFTLELETTSPVSGFSAIQAENSPRSSSDQ